MPRRKGKGGKKRRGGGKGGSSMNPPAGQLVYTGPVSFPRQSMQSTVRMLNFTTTIAASITGVIAWQVNNGSPWFTVGITSSPDWNPFTLLYQEFRVLAMRLRWIPQFTTYSTTATPVIATQLVMSTQRNATAGPPSTAGAAYQNQPYRSGPIMRPMSMTVRMSGATDAAWFDVSAPTGTFALSLTSTNLTVSSSYGQVLIEWLTQFRNPV